ncbi:hypothetical protein AGRA3207_006945 [Actinomadura graeca]|uniref:Uncharacterized protein n=1 Tax=Actinomadura graeca TaxID=2750812 RepID=A0ABX8R3L9_9ACTN|nr:hypothetical protein [Actinomadura graeca]QXJ25453.1 hypothetical protein AGRA3207_006945 [Actinomadura graeca]
MSRSGRGRAAPRRNPGRAPGRAPSPRDGLPEATYPDLPHTPRPSAKGTKRPGGRGSAVGRNEPRGRGAAPVPDGGPEPRRRTRAPGPRAYFWAAGALIAVGAAATGGAVLLRDGDDPVARRAPAAVLGAAASSGPSPASYSSSPTSAAYAGIAQRTADPAPLTAGEAFPSSAERTTVPGGVSLTLRARRVDGDCTAAVWGATVAGDLRRGGCTQAVRGIYSDTRRGYGLAVAVFNLAGSADADRFVDLLDRTRGGGFVRPLEAPAPLASFGRDFGMARGLAMGHFAVVSWAQRLDGTGDERDETLLSLLIEGGKAPAVLGRAARASGRPSS